MRAVRLSIDHLKKKGYPEVALSACQRSLIGRIPHDSADDRAAMRVRTRETILPNKKA